MKPLPSWTFEQSIGIGIGKARLISVCRLQAEKFQFFMVNEQVQFWLFLILSAFEISLSTSVL
jgi:hypothetical protein